MEISPETIASRYRYNALLGRYIDARGRIVPYSVIRSELELFVRGSEAGVAALFAQLRSGSLSAAAWESQMRLQLKVLHMASYALARGGWAQMSPAEYGRMGGLLAFEFDRLNLFALDLEGRQPDGRDLNRARQYARAGRHTFFLALRRKFQERGFTHERSQRSPVDNCPGCTEEEAKGWQPIGQMRPIGTRDCLRNCQCHYYVRNERTGEEEGPF